MGDQADFGAWRKREIRYTLISFVYVLAVCAFIVIFPISRAEGIEGSVNYLWEEKKREDESISKFTQIYDLILSRRLQPLYDASLKFEFRSETGEKEENRERSQLFPSLNMRLGNDMTSLNLGWSKDIITDTYTDTNTQRDYTYERGYMGFDWRPKWLPHILCQIQRDNRKESWQEEPLKKEDRIKLIEEYTLNLGPLTLDHSFDHERKEIDTNVSTTYDLLNKGRIRYMFSFFKERLDISTGYELSQELDKKEDGDRIKEWKHYANLTILGYPADWMRPEYRGFWEDRKEDRKEDTKTYLPYQREILTGHNLSLLFMPHPYFSSTLGMNYNRNEQNQEYGAREIKQSQESGARDTIIYSLKMEPQIKGLIFDPNITMYPILTSILISSSTNRNKGQRESHVLSFLFSGSTTIYQGVDLDLDLSHIQRKTFIPSSRRSLEERVDGYLKLDLLPYLKGSISQKASWTKDKDPNVNERHSFDGKIETRLIYRPIETFMLDAEYTFYYTGWTSGYQYSLGWRPTSKVEVDVRYQSGDRERESYFLGELNLYMTHTIHLGFRYQYPSDDQLMKVEFKLQF